MGASSIRLDIEMHAVFKRYGRWDYRDWSGVDDVVALSRAYALPITAVLIGVPSILSACSDHDEPLRAVQLQRLRELRGRGRRAHARRDRHVRDPQRARHARDLPRHATGVRADAVRRL